MNIKLTNLTHKYSSQTVINDLTFTANNVKSVGIIGESGCGKSTLVRLLSGIEDPTFGEIIINDLSPTTSKIEFQKNIGYVFQKHNLFPHLTIFDNLFLILHKIKKINKIEAKNTINQLLNQLKITETAHKTPNEVSGGQAQRASIARAICTSPEILFLDEPTAALDPLLTNEVLNAVKSLKETGSEFVFITHEMDFLREFADFFIFMDKGKIIEYGDISLLNNPQTEKLQKFLIK